MDDPAHWGGVYKLRVSATAGRRAAVGLWGRVDGPPQPPAALATAAPQCQDAVQLRWAPGCARLP